MGGAGARTALRTIELLMTNPDGMTVRQLACELGMTDHGARERLRSLLREGFVEVARAGRSGPGGEALYRLGPRLRAAAMEGSTRWRSELLGTAEPDAPRAYPRGVINV